MAVEQGHKLWSVPMGEFMDLSGYQSCFSSASVGKVRNQESRKIAGYERSSYPENQLRLLLLLSCDMFARNRSGLSSHQLSSFRS